MAAALAACVVLSACASGEGGQQATTTSPSATEVPGNPWDLPIEQRPALFDPCAEIPVEAIEQGVGGPVEPADQLNNHRPGELLSCGWKNDEVLIGVLSLWKSHNDFSSEGEYVLSQQDIDDRPGYRASAWDGSGPSTCRQLFFTSSGAVLITVDLISGLRSFRGENFAEPCEVLDHLAGPILPYVPEGDHR